MPNFTPAFYAKYIDGHHGSRNRIGGAPDHLPPDGTVCSNCNARPSILMQLYVDEMNLFPNDWLALHLYECTKNDCICPQLIAIKKTATKNHDAVAFVNSHVTARDIEWIQRDDPDPMGIGDDLEHFLENENSIARYPYIHDDKIGGFFPWCDHGGTSGYDLGAIGQFQNPVVGSGNRCGMIYLYNAPERGLYFEYY